MFQLEQIFGKASFNKQDVNVIRTILQAPETAKILERAEQDRIEQRKALRVRLDGIDAKHDKGIDSACKTVVEAVKAREAAEAQLAAARTEEWRVRAVADALESVKACEARELHQQLTDTRDTRLDEFYVHLGDAWDKLRHLGRDSGIVKVQTLMTVLKEAQSDVQCMALLPLTRAEASERLTAWTHRLTPMLHSFALPCPTLDEQGAVTLSRERLKFIDVLQDNGLLEAGDLPRQPHTAQAASPKPSVPKRPAAHKPVATVRNAALAAKKTSPYAMGDGSKRIYF